MTIEDQEFKGWKVWNTGSVLADENETTDGIQYTVKSSDAKDGYILLVADWGEDMTYANNVI